MKHWLLIFLLTFHSRVHAQEDCKIEITDTVSTHYFSLSVAGMAKESNKYVIREQLLSSTGIVPACRFEYRGKQVRGTVVRFVVEIVRDNNVVDRISNDWKFSERFYSEIKDLRNDDIVKIKDVEVRFNDTIDISGTKFVADSLQFIIKDNRDVLDKNTKMAIDAIHGFEQLKRLVAHFCSIAYIDEPCSYMPGVPKYGSDNNLVISRYEFFKLTNEIDYIWTFIYNRTTKQYSVQDGLKGATYTLEEWNEIMAKIDLK